MYQLIEVRYTCRGRMLILSPRRKARQVFFRLFEYVTSAHSASLREKEIIALAEAQCAQGVTLPDINEK